MADSNGWKKFLGGLAAGTGGMVVLGLLFLGGERGFVLAAVRDWLVVKPQAEAHMLNTDAHLSQKEAELLAALPVILDSIDKRLGKIEAGVDKVERRTR